MKEKLSLFVEEYRNSFRVLSILYITNFCETRKIDSNAIQVYFLLPSIEIDLAVVRGLPSKKFLHKRVNEKSSTDRRS